MPLPTPSIADAPRSVDYTPNNSAGPFPVPFPVFEGTGDDLAVTLDGVPVTNWTFAGDQIEDFYGSPGCWVNGTITFDAPITGALRIAGRRRPRRVDQFAEGRGVPARDHNLELNRLTATQREIFDRVEDIAAATSDIIPAVTALTAQAQQAASDAAASADDAEDWAVAAEAAAQLLATHALPDGTDFNALDQRGTYILTSETNAPLPGPTNRWVVEVVADPADADRVVQRAYLLVGGAKLELANRRRLAGATWEPWLLGAGQAVDVGYDDSNAFPGARNVQEALEAAADPWASLPLRVPIPVFDHLGGGAPPTDKWYRYVKLSAGETGPGGYNHGILTDEAVWEPAPLTFAVAIINLPASPMHGQYVRLINTERRFIRAGSSGEYQDDAFQSHLHGPPDGVTGYVTWQSNSLGSSGSIVMGVHSNTGAPVEHSGYGVPRVSTETRPRNIGATYYMRIL